MLEPCVREYWTLSICTPYFRLNLMEKHIRRFRMHAAGTRVSDAEVSGTGYPLVSRLNFTNFSSDLHYNFMEKYFMRSRTHAVGT